MLQPDPAISWDAPTTLDLPTLLVVAIWIAALLGLFLFVAWIKERTIRSLAWWSSAYVIGGSAVALWRFGHQAVLPIPAEVPSALLMLAIGMIWTGARLFHGRSVRPLALLAGAGAWLAATSFADFGEGTGARLALSAAIIACYAFLTAAEVWRDRRVRSCPRWQALLMPVLHASVFLVPVLLPAFAASGRGVSPLDESVAALTLATLLYAIGTAFLIFALVQDRTIRLHKTAASTDPLTGLFNRRAFLEGAQRLIDQHGAKGQPVTVLMFDLDHFKSINDRFGHAVGDSALKLFADTASACMRANDIIGRLGGEEFAAVLPGADDVAATVAERIRAAFQLAGVCVDEQPLHATVSIGAAWTFDAVASERLLAQADAALYRAKASGRNRLALAQAPVRASKPELPRADQAIAAAPARLASSIASTRSTMSPAIPR